jgi:hypothetical protein
MPTNYLVAFLPVLSSSISSKTKLIQPANPKPPDAPRTISNHIGFLGAGTHNTTANSATEIASNRMVRVT